MKSELKRKAFMGDVGTAALLTMQELQAAKEKCAESPEDALQMARVAMMMYADRTGHAEIAEAWLEVREEAIVAKHRKAA